MSDSHLSIEQHNLTVKNHIDVTMAHLRAGGLTHALEELELAVTACEKHPSFARLQESPCNSVPLILDACRTLAEHAGLGADRASGLLERMHVLTRANLH